MHACATVILVSAGLKQQDIKTTKLTVVGTQIEARNEGHSRKIFKDMIDIVVLLMTNDEMREIQVQQDELTRNLMKKFLLT